jgi:hypothetical protein
MRLGQIRRRLRLQAALEGAVVGATVAAAAVAIGLGICRLRGRAPAELGAGMSAVALTIASVSLGALVGAAARAARRIPLDRCARLADAALDGEDRLLSALFLEAGAASAFTRALVADAVRRTEALLPRTAVPPRRPAGLPALALAASALAGAALAPASSSAARIPPAATSAPAHRAALPAAALDGEREAVAAAMAEAKRLGDARLAALAAELDQALRRLAAGTLDDRAALDLLRALAARAGEAARDARRDAQAVEAATQAFAASAETRAAGTAIAPPGGGAADEARAADALTASAVAHPAETARALSAAAQTVAGAGGGANDAGSNEAGLGPRHLAREQDQRQSAGELPATPSAAEPPARHLEQLRRDLDDAASACRSGDPTCGARAGARGRDLAQLERQGAAREALRSLERTAEQLRARVGRGELREGDAQALRTFGQAARGTPGDGEGSGQDGAGHAGDGSRANAEGRGEAGERAGAGEPGAEGPARAHGDDTGAASALLGVAGGERAGEAAGTGNGIGHQPGGPPLGARASESSPARGDEAEVPLADGAGPSRAEVIGTAAGQGFTSHGYARAYADYAAAVEDALSAAAVPDGKRYLVRRYFDLIRPRTPARAPGGRP